MILKSLYLKNERKGREIDFAFHDEENHLFENNIQGKINLFEKKQSLCSSNSIPNQNKSKIG